MSSHTTHPKPTQTNTHNTSSSTACAACKYQRRRCSSDCTLAPHFPANNLRQFLNVHRLFGVSNILKILKNVEPHLHKEAMASIIFQSNARARDPVGGCYRIILELKHQIDHVFSELQLVLRQIALYRAQIEAAATMANSNEANYTPAATTVDAYGNVATTQQQQQQQHCSYFFNDGGEEQASQQVVNGHDSNINILANGVGFDMAMNMLGNDLLEMEMISPKENYVQEEEMKQLVDIFDVRNTFEDDEASKNVTAGSPITALHCSSNAELNAHGSPMERMQEHDLKGAASLFSLKNYSTSFV